MNFQATLLVSVVVVFACCNAVTYDCNSGHTDNVPQIDVPETSPVDYLLLQVNNSYAPLHWEATANGTNGDYLPLFFQSSTVEGANHTHALTLTKALDLELLMIELASANELFEENNEIMLVLDLSVFCATDGQNLLNELKFKINIHAVNEFYPQFKRSPFTTKVSESTVVGTQIFEIGSKVTDLDAGNTNLTFAIAPYMITQFDGSGYVTMDDKVTGVIVLSKPLDYESLLFSGRTYKFVNITATDDGGFTSATSLNITVTDYNDQGVQLVYPGCERPCLTANYTVTTNESYIGPLIAEPVAIFVEDLDTLNDKVMYMLTNDSDEEFFEIDASTGRLSKTAALVNDTYGYSISLQVKAQEVTDEEHYIKFNVTVLIEERLPRPSDKNRLRPAQIQLQVRK